VIRVANLLSADLNELAGAVADALRQRTGEQAEVDTSAGLSGLRAGRVDVALVCGLAHVLVREKEPDCFAAVMAPVVDDGRGGDAAVYFSDIIVPAGSPARGLDDLAGGRFARNETISFSGYRALEHALGVRGLSPDLFGGFVHTGSHAVSLELVAQNRADAAAIDSQVLLLAQRRDRELAGRIRVLEALGPYPAPPVVVNREVCGLTPDTLREVLRHVPPDVLRRAGIRRWQAVDDAFYDPLRAIARSLPDLRLPCRSCDGQGRG
jgi:phosphonate transport system substrate-binding protein